MKLPTNRLSSNKPFCIGDVSLFSNKILLNELSCEFSGRTRILKYKHLIVYPTIKLPGFFPPRKTCLNKPHPEQSQSLCGMMHNGAWRILNCVYIPRINYRIFRKSMSTPLVFWRHICAKWSEPPMSSAGWITSASHQNLHQFSSAIPTKKNKPLSNLSKPSSSSLLTSPPSLASQHCPNWICKRATDSLDVVSQLTDQTYITISFVDFLPESTEVTLRVWQIRVFTLLNYQVSRIPLL